MSYSDVMLDLETLGKSPGCIVMQIGVCLFNRVGDAQVKTAKWNLSLEAQQAAGLKADVDTICWWMLQSDEARMSWAAGSVERVLPSHALGTLSDLIKAECAFKPTVWANSPQFDFSILDPLWRIARVAKPWMYFQEADMRTLKLVAPTVAKVLPALAHDAASDAEAQARYVQDVFAHLAMCPEILPLVKDENL